MDALISKFTGAMMELSERRIREQMSGPDGEEFSRNLQKNRYNNIIPYVSTYPCDFYFNGNVVAFQISDHKFEFLVTQAPVDLDDYYSVICQYKPPAVVQVSRFADQFVLKAERYIPLSPESEDVEILRNAVVASRFGAALRAQLSGAPYEQVERLTNMDCQYMVWHRPEMQLKDCTIKTLSYKQISSFYRYEISVKRNKAYETRFSYVYYPNWTDFAAPDSFHEVFALCKLVAGMNRILVHCSAGIGRSATFCICFCIYEQFRLGFADKTAPQGYSWGRLRMGVMEMIEEFRTQRHPQCVQTVEQFKFILEFCNYCSDQTFE